MKRLALTFLLAASAAAQLPDLIFERGNPNAFQTLQAALDAAQPGQRVIMRSDAQSTAGQLGLITKSVTIEGQYAGPEFRVQSIVGLRVTSLTPGIPLILRRLQFSMRYVLAAVTTSAIYDERASPIYRGSDVIVMEDVSIEAEPLSQPGRKNEHLAIVRSHKLLLRRCRFVAPDTSNGPGCYEGLVASTGALLFQGWPATLALHMEDCYLRAGSAGILSYPQGVACPAYPVGDRGGAAITLQNLFMSVCAVRSTISDGNGGSVAPGPWPSPPVPGLAGRSTPVDLLLGYQFIHEHGRDDAGGPGVSRGSRSTIGNVDAPLFLSDAIIGGDASVTVTTSQLSPVAITLGTSLELSYFGIYGSLLVPLYPAPSVLPFPSVGVRPLHIPLRPDLIGQPLVVQLIALYNGFPFISNPSVSHIGR